MRDKPLLMVIACHKFRDRIQAIRNTWLPTVHPDQLDYKFFFGQPPADEVPETDEEVFLDVKDDYESLPLKIQAAFSWSLHQGYQHAFKSDDDNYVLGHRLAESNYRAADYIGRWRGPSDYLVHGDNPAPYASGGPGYWLSRRAMQIVAAAKHNGDWAEDRWVANILYKHGISCTHNPGYCLWPWNSGGQDDGLSFITACNFDANRSIYDIHEMYEQHGRLVATQLTPQPPPRDLPRPPGSAPAKPKPINPAHDQSHLPLSMRPVTSIFPSHRPPWTPTQPPRLITQDQPAYKVGNQPPVKRKRP